MADGVEASAQAEVPARGARGARDPPCPTGSGQRAAAERRDRGDRLRRAIRARTIEAIRLEGLEWYEDLPASAAVRAGDFLFVSGQVALDGGFRAIAPGDLDAQARRAFEYLGRILEEVGGTLDDVVDVMSFHKDVRDVDRVLEIARDYFSSPYPAWTPVGTTGSYTPEILLSVRAIAHLGDVEKTAVGSASDPASTACRKGELLFVSVDAADADGNVLHPGDHDGQARAAYAHAQEVVEAAGATMGDVIDICSFHLDPRGMIPCERVHNETWAETPLENAPAWTAIGAPALRRPQQLGAYRMIADTSDGPRIAETPASLHWKHCPISGGTRKEGGRLIGIAGEVASDAEGNVTTPGDTLDQARYAFNRIREVVEMHGVDMGHVVEITSFHKDARAWEIVMEAGREYFDADSGPAWTPAGMTGLWNPGYLHEIYALAVV